jgi:hypothetical protein
MRSFLVALATVSLVISAIPLPQPLTIRSSPRSKRR